MANHGALVLLTITLLLITIELNSVNCNTVNNVVYTAIEELSEETKQADAFINQLYQFEEEEASKELISLYKSNKTSFPPPPPTLATDAGPHCGLCQFLIPEFTNETTVDEAIAELEAACNEIFAANETALQHCLTRVNTSLTEIANDVDDHIKDYSPLQYCTIISLCKVNCCLTYQEPEQVHIIYDYDYYSSSLPSVTISWVTSEMFTGVAELYSTDNNKVTVPCQIVANNYTASEVGGWNGTIHHCTASNLDHNSQYQYRVGNSATNVWSKFFKFSLPSANNGTASHSFALMGDMGTRPEGLNTAEALGKLVDNGEIEYVVHAGDLAYANTYQPIWDIWSRSVESFAARVPHQIVEGNHEKHDYFVPFKSRIAIPRNSSHSPNYWSFDWENVHFVFWSAEQGLDALYPGAKQREWLERDLTLANRNRCNVPWIFLVGHRPFYCTRNSTRCSVEAVQFRVLLENIIYTHKVDVVFAGHNHQYERTFPVFDGQRTSSKYKNPKAPVYYVVGTAGRDRSTDFANVDPKWLAKRFPLYGFLHITATAGTSLELNFRSNKLDFPIVDTVKITKEQPICK